MLDHAKISEILGSSSYVRVNHARVNHVRARSVAVWPDTISLGNIANESSDEHDSLEAAYGVCRLLEKEGFGGEGKVFPLSTRVEPIE